MHVIVAIKCKPNEKVQHRTMQGNCVEPIKDAGECFRRAVSIGILKNKNEFENINYWGEGEWDIFPSGCLYFDGFITFNTNKNSHKCGINNKAMCLCMPACYSIQHPFEISNVNGRLDYASKSRVIKCFDKIAENRNIEKLRILFLGVSTLGQIWNELSSRTHEKARKCQDGIPQENDEFDPHTIEFPRWNFISPASAEHGKAREDIQKRIFCNQPGAVERLLNNHVEYMKDDIDDMMKVEKYGYNKIVIQVGAWDATWGDSDSAFEISLDNAVKYLLRELRPYDIILLTQSPEGHYFVGDPSSVYGHSWVSIQEKTIRLNHIVRKIAKKYKTELVDAYYMVITRPEKVKRWFWENGAGWHLSRQSGMSIRIAEEILGTLCSSMHDAEGNGGSGADNNDINDGDIRNGRRREFLSV